MPKITGFIHKPEKDRYWIYVDGVYCCSVRERTFPALGLSVGQEIGCEAIKELENHHWKHSYGAAAWDKEKVRLSKAKTLIESMDSRVAVEIVGFGADTNEFIAGHPEESGKPDMQVLTQKGSVLLLLVEVTGTETMRGNTYWVRPDKLEYAKNHPNEDVWIILHYAQPEKFIFIKPDPSNVYKLSDVVIRGATEHFVAFTDASPGVFTQAEFAAHLEHCVNSAMLGIQKP